MSENKVLCGDASIILDDFPDNIIDLTLTSPPYDDIRDYDGYSFDFESIAKSLYRITKEGGVVVWVVADQTIDGDESGTSFNQALYFKDIGFNLYDTMIYLKKPRGGSGQGYWNTFEYMFVLSKGKPNTINLLEDRPNLDSRKNTMSGHRDKSGEMKRRDHKGWGDFGRRTNVWEYAIGYGSMTKDKIASEHPAMFPEKLASDHIKSWSNKGDLVLDPMMGSGTTLKMAKFLERRYIGIDTSENYCEIVNNRLNPEQMELF